MWPKADRADAIRMVLSYAASDADDTMLTIWTLPSHPAQMSPRV